MQLFSEDMRRDPYPLYARLREGAAVLHFAPADAFLLLGYDEVKRALTDHALFSSDVSATRGVQFEWLLFMDPPRHSAQRALIMRAFTPRSIASLEPRIRALASDLLERCVARSHFDLVRDFAEPLPILVIAHMLGLEDEDLTDLAAFSEAIVNLGSTVVGSAREAAEASDAFTRADAAMAELVTTRLHERRVAPRDDLLTRLATADIDGQRLHEKEILRLVQLLLAAGTETTTNLLGNAVLTLLDHRSTWYSLREHPALVVPMLEETLRFRSPVQAVFRRTRRDVQLGSVCIPEGKLVLPSIGAANRDPAHFREPERFDILRSPNAHLSFGQGVHHCLGAALARLEARVAFEVLLSRVRELRRTSAAPVTPRKPFQVHGPASLVVEAMLH